MLKFAFKEWAVICRALAAGRQALILRKGGIAEEQNDFRLAHTRFWLYPTYTHQQRSGIVAEAVPVLEEVAGDQPPPGTIRLSHFAEVAGVYHARTLPTAMMVHGLHLWSEDTVAARFAYRSPGLYIVPVRVYRAAQVHELPERSEYAGCRSWVELDRELPTEGAPAVLAESQFGDLLRTLDRLLNPTALA